MNTTCWTVIRDAAGGDAPAREEFARRYEGLVRAYLLARWRGGPAVQDVDDAVQEVFVESFRAGGVLEAVDPARHPGGFRPFLYGVLRNVALRFESRRARRRDVQPSTGVMAERPDDDETRLSRLFDRQWAAAIMRDAADRQREAARASGEDALQRVELLRLRFRDGLPIREIASRWGLDPAHVHREYAKARREFRHALLEAVAFHHPAAPEAVERECEELLAMLE